MTPGSSLEQKSIQASLVEPGIASALPLETLISNLLRCGVVISMSLIASGTLLTFARHPDYLTSTAALARLTRPTQTPHDLSEVLAGVSAARGQALTMAGLLLLISIPVTRVGLSLLVFRYQRDRLFVAITGSVLCLLLLSFIVGQATG